MRTVPLAIMSMFALRAAGFMATSTLGESPGVEDVVVGDVDLERRDPVRRCPAGARISAGKSGKVDRSLPSSALLVVNRSPVSCMPSPESPAKRTMTWSICSVACCVPDATGCLVSVVAITARPGSCHVGACRHGAAALSVRIFRSCAIFDPAAQHAHVPLVGGVRRSGRAEPGLRNRPGGTGEAVPDGSGDRHLGVEVDVLDGVDEGGALGHRTLEGLAADDQALPAGALVDRRRCARPGPGRCRPWTRHPS